MSARVTGYVESHLRRTYCLRQGGRIIDWNLSYSQAVAFVRHNIGVTMEVQ